MSLFDYLIPCVCLCTDRLALIRQQREEAAKKREEEKAGKTKHYLFLKITVSDLILMSYFYCSERREESRCSQMSQVFQAHRRTTLLYN